MSIPTNLNDWDFAEKHVQDIGTGGDFLSSESIILCSGPPIAPVDGIPNLLPIGLVQNVQVNQSKQIQQLFEIGSRTPFFVPGRTLVQAGLSRVLFDGPSLLKAVYMQTQGGEVVVAEDPFVPEDIEAGDAPNPGVLSPDEPGGPTGTGSDFYINLASKFFNKPLGLGFILRDQENESYGGFYLEDCYIQTHSFSAAGQQTVLIENVGIRASRVVPISEGT